MVRNLRQVRQPASRRPGLDAAVVRKHQLPALRGEAVIVRPAQRGPAAGGTLGARQQQQRIGLALAELGPAVRRRLGHVDDEVVGRLDVVEPLTGVRRAARIPDQLGASELAECIDQPGGEAREVDLQTLRQDREGARAAHMCARRRAIHALQPTDHQLRNAPHGFRLTAQYFVECSRGNARQLRVAQRHDVGRARMTRDQPHLPDGVPGGEPGEKSALGAPAGGQHCEAAAEHHVQRIGRLARGEQHRAARQRQPLGGRRDGAEERRCKAAEQRHFPQ